MAGWQEQLNTILSDPDAMAQLASIAQSLGGAPPENAKGETPNAPDAARLLSSLTERLHLRDFDTGDLLLLAVLLLLFREKGDEEALIALGLLLIL